MPRVRKNRRSFKTGPWQLPDRLKAEQACAAGTASTPASAGVGLLAPASSCSLPSLAGIPASFLQLSGTKPLFQLCYALVQQNIGDGALWNSVDGNALSFAKIALERWANRQGADVVDDYFGYAFAIADHCDSYDNPLAEGELCFALEAESSSCLQIGAALDALEAERPGLGAAFYSVFLKAIDRWIYSFDHREALFLEECMIEWAKEEAEEGEEVDLEQYEIPNIKGATPAYIQTTPRKSLRGSLSLLNEHTTGPHGNWITSLLRLYKCFRRKTHPSVMIDLRDVYDAGPLPPLLIVFKAYDVISAIFDHEFENAYDCSHAPQLALKCNPAQPGQLRRTLKALSSFLQFNKELSLLLATLNAFAEKTDEAEYCDRSEPQRRAA